MTTNCNDTTKKSMKNNIENGSIEKVDQMVRLKQQIEMANVTLEHLEYFYEKGMPVKALTLKKIRVIYTEFYTHLGGFLQEQCELWKTTLNPSTTELGNIHALQKNIERLNTVVNRVLFLTDNIDTLSDEIEKFDLLGEKKVDRIH